MKIPLSVLGYNIHPSGKEQKNIVHLEFRG
jgi:hypothetical protein